MSEPQQSTDLAVLRTQIDSLDQQLLTLLNQRAVVAEKVGELKRREGSPFFRPDRVAQVIEKIQSATGAPCSTSMWVPYGAKSCQRVLRLRHRSVWLCSGPRVLSASRPP